ncbi:peptidylprolyl isomerase [Variovorax sp. J22R115]|uniref:peptidylprolyl isomerase n=1 Tax=Variovorax sp. J22R115 TaxID=3053509 RepID=UPI0025758594|nr:peptidylprolyl isomerase [Variovorax sp. J22R115]MDM0052744.1 peptidylprolyl isomerase [Variovorax sp. J22R115]
MNHLRSILTLACLASVATASGAQGTGITDIMRAGPRLAPAPTAAPRPPVPNVQRSAEYIVALVNSEPITNTEVQARAVRILRDNPEAARYSRQELMRLVLERLINERAQMQVAKEQGIRVDDIAIDQAEQTVARNNQVSVTDLRRRVAEEGLSQEQFRRELREQLTLIRLRDREIENKIKITDVEVDQFIRDQRSGTNAAIPPNINIAQLLVAVPESASDADVAKLQQRAQGLAQRARAGEDFTKLVQEFSDSPDRASGGAIGMRSAERYPQLLVEATQSTPVNGIAGPVRSAAGFHVLKLLAKSQPNSGDAVVTQTQVRHILLLNDAKRTTAESIAKLNQFKQQVQNGTADFAVLARDNSQDGSAKDGGDLGWARPGQFVPEFEEAMNRLAPGQTSDPLVSRFGVHLIQVVGRRDAKLSQAEQREAARAMLRQKRIAEATETWAQEVRARAYVEMREPPQS